MDSNTEDSKDNPENSRVWPPSFELPALSSAIVEPRDTTLTPMPWLDFVIGFCAPVAILVIVGMLEHKVGLPIKTAATYTTAFLINAPCLWGLTPWQLGRSWRTSQSLPLAYGSRIGTVIFALVLVTLNLAATPADQNCHCAYVGNAISTILAP